MCTYLKKSLLLFTSYFCSEINAQMKVRQTEVALQNEFAKCVFTTAQKAVVGKFNYPKGYLPMDNY